MILLRVALGVCCDLITLRIRREPVDGGLQQRIPGFAHMVLHALSLGHRHLEKVLVGMLAIGGIWSYMSEPGLRQRVVHGNGIAAVESDFMVEADRLGAPPKLGFNVILFAAAAAHGDGAAIVAAVSICAVGLALYGNGMGIRAILVGVMGVATVGWGSAILVGFVTRDRVEGRGKRLMRRRGIELELLETM